MAQLIILGSIYVILTTAGNSIHLQHNFASFIGVVVGIVAITISCILSFSFDVQFFLINTYKYPDYAWQFVYIFALGLGCFLLLFQIKALLYVLIPRSIWKKLPFGSFWLTCEMAKSERCTKQAAAYKVKKMVGHAIAQHDGSSLDDTKSERLKLKLKTSSFTSSHAKAILSFQGTADHREQAGGILYTFRKIWDGSLFTEEGVFIHSRLYAMNVSQWFIVIVYIILYASIDLLIQSIFNPVSEAPSVSPSPTSSFSPTSSPAPTMDPQELVAILLPSLTDAVVSMAYLGEDLFRAVWQNFTATNIDLATTFTAKLLNFSSPELKQSVAYLQDNETLSIFATALANTRRLVEVTQEYRYLQEATDDGYSDPEWFPTESEVRLAASGGCIVALFAAAYLALVWIPSSVSTIMQFRCGYIGSLRNRSFNEYRQAPDLTTVLFGSAFWGTFYCTAAILIIVSTVTFLLVWSATRSIVLNLLANLIGIMVTLTFKILLLICVRKMLFVGFFRRRPIGGNLLLLVLGTSIPFFKGVLLMKH